MENIVCELCGRNFSSIRSLCGHKTHCGRETKKHCDICNRDIHESGWGIHCKGHEKDLECLECGKRIFFFEDRYKFCSSSCSAKYNNRKRNRDKKTYHCEMCGKILSTKGAKKYCSRKCQQDYQWEQRKKEYIDNEEIPSPSQRRRFLLERDGNVCELCGLSEWKGMDIPLVADHIDGNSENNSISNLRLICCNCDAQLPTYKARNTGNGRAYRRKRYKEGKSY